MTSFKCGTEIRNKTVQSAAIPQVMNGIRSLLCWQASTGMPNSPGRYFQVSDGSVSAAGTIRLTFSKAAVSAALGGSFSSAFSTTGGRVSSSKGSNHTLWHPVQTSSSIPEISSVCGVIFFAGLPLLWQLLIFGLGGAVLAVASRWIAPGIFRGTVSKSDSDIDADNVAGEYCICRENIVPGVPGKVEFRGTLWRAESAVPVSAGENCVIEKRENLTLTVHPLNGNN